jgi:hypothetical protein
MQCFSFLCLLGQPKVETDEITQLISIIIISQKLTNLLGSSCFGLGLNYFGSVSGLGSIVPSSNRVSTPRTKTIRFFSSPNILRSSCQSNMEYGTVTVSRKAKPVVVVGGLRSYFCFSVLHQSSPLSILIPVLSPFISFHLSSIQRFR